MLCIIRAIFLLSMVLGVYGGGCYTSGTNLKCTNTFMGEPLTLEIDVKACQKPVKISIVLVIIGQTFSKEFDGQEDIPLPGLSLEGIGGFVLTVNANPLDNGNLQLEIGIKGTLLGFSSPSETILSETIPNHNCNAFLLWWNSQSLVVKIAIPASAGLLLILSIIACYCCCCRKSRSREEATITRHAFAMPTQIPLHSPAGNQYKYKPQVNITDVSCNA